MGEKVKVSRELAKAIEIVTTKHDESYLLWLHRQIQRTGSGWETGYPGCDSLDGISTIKFAEILINGYEVEETPEEKILKTYQSKNDGRLQSDDMKWINDAYTNGIVFTLEMLGIKIKGINE